MKYLIYDRFEDNVRAEECSQTDIIKEAQLYFEEHFLDEYPEEATPRTWEEALEFWDTNEFDVIAYEGDLRWKCTN